MRDDDRTDAWDRVGFIISSKYRIAVVRRLVENPSTPTAIASHADLPTTHVSRALRALAEQSLVELQVPADTRKGRVYGITDLGRQLWQRIRIAGLID